MNAESQGSVRRALRLLEALKGATHTGVSNAELAKASDDSPSNVSRSLDVLIEEGFVAKLDNGRFAHSIKLLQIAQAHADHTARLTARITETNQRIAAGSFD